MITRGDLYLHPDSSKWYWLQWSATELGDGVTISAVNWTLPAGISEDATSQSGLTVGIRLSNVTGSVGDVFDVTCQIVTTNSETLHEVLRITLSTDGH